MNECPHCKPYKVSTHLPDKFLFWVEFCGRHMMALVPGRLQRAARRLFDRVWVWILNFLRLVGVVTFEAEPDRTKLRNRGLVFFDAGRAAGVDVRTVTFFGRPSGEYAYEKGGKWQTYQEIPELPPHSTARIDDKTVSKRVFAQHDLPHAAGKAFFRTPAGLSYGKSLGFPLVVKPTGGSLSKHVTKHIQTEAQLQEAIEIAKEHSPRYIVERHIDGKLFRATVLGEKQVFVCQKRAASVVGDGVKNIRELIKEKNNHQLRGDGQRDTTLHKISPTEASKFLEQSRLSLSYRPDAGQQVFLSDSFSLKLGCDIIEMTPDVHPENLEMFRAAARAFQTGLVSFDFLADDIRTSWQEQPCALLEANSLPYADMHRFPSEGEPQPIGEAAWKIIREAKNLER